MPANGPSAVASPSDKGTTGQRTSARRKCLSLESDALNETPAPSRREPGYPGTVPACRTLKKNRKTLRMNLAIFFRNHMEKRMKRMTSIPPMIGCFMTSHRTPTTSASSVTLATELVTGSGEVFMARREVAL